MLIAILIIIIIASLAALAYLFVRRFPDLKNLDVNSVVSEKQNEAKAKILQAKLSRSGVRFKEGAKKLATPIKDFFSGRLKELKEKVSRLEAQYQVNGATKETEKSLDDLLKEADELLDKADFDLAERRLIEAVAKDKESVLAYERLGDLYYRKKNYDQAEEVYHYLLKLKALKASGASGEIKRGASDEAEADFLASFGVEPGVAGYYDALGQIYEVTDKGEKALDAYLKASSVEPNNPRYLDKLIEFGIKAGDRGLAKKAFNQLKEINPENAKLGELKEAIEKM